MIFFVTESNIQPEHQYNIGYFIMGIVGFIFLVNIVILVIITKYRLKLWLKRRRAFKARTKVFVAHLLSKHVGEGVSKGLMKKQPMFAGLSKIHDLARDELSIKVQPIESESLMIKENES